MACETALIARAPRCRLDGPRRHHQGDRPLVRARRKQLGPAHAQYRRRHVRSAGRSLSLAASRSAPTWHSWPIRLCCSLPSRLSSTWAAQLQKASLSLARLFEYVDHQPESDPSEAYQPAPDSLAPEHTLTGRFALDNVRFRYCGRRARDVRLTSRPRTRRNRRPRRSVRLRQEHAAPNARPHGITRLRRTAL